MPSGRFAANAAWLAIQVMAHNLARWTARFGLGEKIVTTKTLPRRFFSLAGRLTLHLPRSWPWETQFSRALARLRAIPLPAGWRPSATDPPSGQLNIPANSRHPSPRAPLAVSYPAISLTTAAIGRHRRPQKHLQTARQPPVYPNASPDHRACNSRIPLPLSSRRPSVSIGGFGLILVGCAAGRETITYGMTAERI